MWCCTNHSPRASMTTCDTLRTLHRHSSTSLTWNDVQMSIDNHSSENVQFLMYCDIIDIHPHRDTLIKWVIENIVPDLNISHWARLAALKGDFDLAKHQVYILMKQNRLL